MEEIKIPEDIWNDETRTTLAQVELLEEGIKELSKFISVIGTKDGPERFDLTLPENHQELDSAKMEILLTRWVYVAERVTRIKGQISEKILSDLTQKRDSLVLQSRREKMQNLARHVTFLREEGNINPAQLEAAESLYYELTVRYDMATPTKPVQSQPAEAAEGKQVPRGTDKRKRTRDIIEAERQGIVVEIPDWTDPQRKKMQKAIIGRGQNKLCVEALVIAGAQGITHDELVAYVYSGKIAEIERMDPIAAQKKMKQLKQSLYSVRDAAKAMLEGDEENPGYNTTIVSIPGTTWGHARYALAPLAIQEGKEGQEDDMTDNNPTNDGADKDDVPDDAVHNKPTPVGISQGLSFGLPGAEDWRPPEESLLTEDEITIAKVILEQLRSRENLDYRTLQRDLIDVLEKEILPNPNPRGFKRARWKDRTHTERTVYYFTPKELVDRLSTIMDKLDVQHNPDMEVNQALTRAMNVEFSLWQNKRKGHEDPKLYQIPEEQDKKKKKFLDLVMSRLIEAWRNFKQDPKKHKGLHLGVDTEGRQFYIIYTT